jgi:flavin-dependent dehydrogenase
VSERRQAISLGGNEPVGETVDVAVLGGGPAGSCAALSLARAGWCVALVERSRYDLPRIGETLPPEALGLLRALGVADLFHRTEPLPSPGIVSVWGSERPYENDFLFNPWGPGWHIDRPRFDAGLAAAAGAAGAHFYRETRLRSCRRESAGGWALEMTNSSRTIVLRASFLMDATGRACWLGHRLGARRWAADALVGVVGFVGCGGSAWDGDRRTLVEAAEDGWWYSALLPDGRTVAAYMTDADLLPAGPRSLAHEWVLRLEKAPYTRDRLGRAPAPPGLRVLAARSYLTSPLAHDDWLAVGDAASAYDPLSSLGIFKAISTGFAAARAAADALGGESAAPGAYALSVRRDFSAYLRQWEDHYGRERRWPHAAFWRRRHHPAVPSRR